jgi:hypothetical protein
MTTGSYRRNPIDTAAEQAKKAAYPNWEFRVIIPGTQQHADEFLARQKAVWTDHVGPATAERLVDGVWVPYPQPKE